MPPKLGLQEQVPILSTFGVTRAVRAPALAAAAHASAPACPPPMTTTSNGPLGGLVDKLQYNDHCTRAELPRSFGDSRKPPGAGCQSYSTYTVRSIK